MMEQLQNYVASLPAAVTVLLLVAVLLIYISPSILALFYNPTQFRKIAAVNLIAGASWPAWAATLVWAVSGRMNDRVDAMLKRSASNKIWLGLIALILVAAIAFGAF
jgi:hypothetical protein